MDATGITYTWRFGSRVSITVGRTGWRRVRAVMVSGADNVPRILVGAGLATTAFAYGIDVETAKRVVAAAERHRAGVGGLTSAST
jgi:hypothetical protein